MLQFTRPLLFSARATQPVKMLKTDLLCQQFEKLSFAPSITPTIITRTFFTSTKLFDHKVHLNRERAIKEEYLEQRRQFLQTHQLLKDKSHFEGKIVYDNFHLYDVNQIDKYGFTNLERMQNGLAPIAKDGIDYLVIHHFDQTHHGDWIILLNSFHTEHDLALHTHAKVNRGVVRHVFAKERIAYWQHIANTHLDKKVTSGSRKK